jgi:hypothetical protein
MTENILEFPKSKIVREHVGAELMEKRLEQGNKNFVDQFCNELQSFILAEISNCDVDIHDDQFLKDFYKMCGILEATMFRAYKLEHPLHDLMDKIQIIELDKEGVDKDK